MTLRAVTKAKRKQRTITCPECRGQTESVAVTVRNLRGPDTDGIEVRHIACACCGSAGRVKAKLAPACCCSLPMGEPRCPNCAPSPRGIHVCISADFEDWDYAMRIAAMDSPRAGAKTTAAAQALGNGVGERSGQRGNR